MALQKASPGVIQKSNEGFKLSLYDAGVIEPQEMLTQMNRLRAAFPRQSAAFFSLLTERVIKHGFSADRLRDAVNHIIDTFNYKEINISDIIGYDRCAKLYTYHEVCALITKGEAAWDDFEMREIDGTNYRIRKSDRV